MSLFTYFHLHVSLASFLLLRQWQKIFSPAYFSSWWASISSPKFLRAWRKGMNFVTLKPIWWAQRKLCLTSLSNFSVVIVKGLILRLTLEVRKFHQRGNTHGSAVVQICFSLWELWPRNCFHLSLMVIPGKKGGLHKSRRTPSAWTGRCKTMIKSSIIVSYGYIISPPWTCFCQLWNFVGLV